MKRFLMLQAVLFFLSLLLFFFGFIGRVTAQDRSFPPASRISLQADNPVFTVNNRQKLYSPAGDLAPVIIGGRLFAPMEELIRELGGRTGWPAGREQLAIKLDGQIIQFQLYSPVVFVNGRKERTPSGPFVLRGRMFIPLSSLIQAFRWQATWDNRQKEVFLTVKPSAPNNWSIGILTGKSPFSLQESSAVANPVLSAWDVTDVPASFVADPFLIRKENRWYMFFEVMNKKSRQGDIGLAESPDGLHWQYRKIILDESFHLSYPYVFSDGGTYYMIPETGQMDEIRLYRALDFPADWVLEAVLLRGNFRDSSVFYFQGLWWMFTESDPSGNGTLSLYYAEHLTGSWKLHPKNPLVSDDAHRARPGGRVLVLGDQVIRIAQDDDPEYGKRLRAFTVTKLTISEYAEQEISAGSAFQPSGTGWNRLRVHHLDPVPLDRGYWLGCADGSDL